jgi:hypothetical protein
MVSCIAARSSWLKTLRELFAGVRGFVDVFASVIPFDLSLSERTGGCLL